MVHAAYRGVVLAHTDLMTGRIKIMFNSVPSSIGYIRAGQTRALAVITATRSDVLPELPTIAEFVAGFEVMGWFGVCAPKNTRPEIAALLNREINAAIADPAIKEPAPQTLPLPLHSVSRTGFGISHPSKRRFRVFRRLHAAQSNVASLRLSLDYRRRDLTLSRNMTPTHQKLWTRRPHQAQI
jgi:hypothetical protein